MIHEKWLSNILFPQSSLRKYELFSVIALFKDCSTKPKKSDVCILFFLLFFLAVIAIYVYI